MTQILETGGQPRNYASVAHTFFGYRLITHATSSLHVCLILPAAPSWGRHAMLAARGGMPPPPQSR